MKSVIVFSSLTAIAAVAAVASGSAALHAQTPVQSKYAESLYADFSLASANRVSFDVKTISSGPLKQLEGRSFAQVIGEPRYSLDFDENRSNRVINPRFNLSVPQVDRNQLDAGVEGFDVVGLPVGNGRYRNLAIQTTANGQTRTHQAIEFCWAALDHCVVYDPQIEFVDSVVNNYRIAKAEGYGPRIQEQQAVKTRGDVSTQAVCRLASNTNNIGRSSTWSARTVKYKNVFGMTLVTKNLAGQQTGIICSASCAPSMYGYSYQSSASGTLGYSATCGNKHTTGTTGGKGTAVSETKCTHTFTGSARADVTVKGVGSGINLAWNTNGGIDGAGGALTDTCAYF